MSRVYNRPVPTDPDSVDLMTAEQFKEQVNQGWICNYDGNGYWVKDGMECKDEEVFSSEQEDATHVAWYAKPN